MLNITEEQVLLLRNIADGLLKPVDKLLSADELDEILNSYEHLGKLYALPYLFFVDEVVTADVLKLHFNGLVVATITAAKTYQVDLRHVAERVFGTTSTDHPGVKAMMQNEGRYCLSGYVSECKSPVTVRHSDKKAALETVFQSRNPPHKAHEAIIAKYAPSLTYTTPFSTVKAGDYPFDLKLRAYERIHEVYGVDLLVTTLPRVFAGPREALQNCLVFQNLGAKRFIMGRGKNCVGDFYGERESYDFCRKFYDEGRMTIEPIWEDTMYSDGEEIKASVIKRDYIDRGITPPERLMSTNISEILLNG